MFTPIPKVRDARLRYQLKPMSTGPYQVVFHDLGKQLRLTTNPYWDPATDPVRHRYAGGFDFRFGADPVRIRRAVLIRSGRRRRDRRLHRHRSRRAARVR